MKMQLKRIVSAVCAVALCASVVSTPVLANDDTGAGNTTTNAIQTTEPTPEPTEQVTEPTPEPTEQVTEPTPEPTAQTNDTLDDGSTEQPSATPTATPDVPDSNEQPDALNKVATYSSPAATDVSVHVNDSIRIGTNQGYNHQWTVDEINNTENPYIGTVQNDGTMTITGLKATGAKTVTVTHKYTTVSHIFWETTHTEEFSVTVLPEEPAKIYFFVSIPTNEAMSSQASDYRFLMVGGEVDNPQSLVEYQESNPIISYDDETILTDCVAEWPQTDKDGKIYLKNTNGYGSDPVDSSSWIELKDGKITDFYIKFSYADEQGITQVAEYTPTDAEGNTYALRWTKFSYAGTTGENWQFHMDAMLYQSVTVEDALTEIGAAKHVDGDALDASGNATASTFSFKLASADKDRTFTPLDLTATVAAGSDTENISAVNDTVANTELIPGDYVITETAPDSNIWNAPDDQIEFTVASDGSVTVKSGTDATIDNTRKKYTVTYDSGVTEDEEKDSVTGMPEPTVQSYAYNAAVQIASAPSRAGYQFTGWLGSDKNSYEAGKKISITGSITLTAQWSELGTGSGGTTGSVEIDKTATDLVGDQTNVTLSVGADQKKVGSDVVFVLDKSTSTQVKNEALAMLNELMDRAKTNGLDVKVGVVTFNKTANNSEFNLALTQLNDTSYNKIQTIFNQSLSGGTNMEAGIRAGMAMLQSDNTVYDTNKHLVLVSDGVAYMWGAGDEPQTVYVHLGNTWAASVDMVHPDYQYRDQNFESYKNAAQWMATAKAGGIEEIINKYQTTYTVPYGSNIGVVAPDETPYSSLECAIYMAGKAWQEAAAAGYHLYAYAPNDYTVKYPWAPNFVSGMYTIGGRSTLYSDTETGVDGMFDEVEDTVLYTIQKGTVTDVIGTDFDLEDLTSLKLTVGSDDPLTGIQDPEDPTKIYFGTQGEDGTYPYVVTYYKNGTQSDSREQFVWEINTPVKSNAGLQLTYTLKLVNPSDEVGDYTVKTNEEATLDYTSTTGDKGSETFPVPEKTYHVAKLEPAAMTIYMGGEEGYEGVSENDGEIVGSNSLPQPGFYITLPNEVNNALKAANVQPEDGTSQQPVNLSKYIKIYTTDDTDGRQWTLASYGASYSAAYSKYIYAVVPDQNADPNTDAFRLNFTDEQGNVYDSDNFSLTDNLSQQYKMVVYPELVNKHEVVIEVDIPETEDTEAVNYRCTMVTGTADLNIRYVTDGENTTQVSTDIDKTSETEDSAQTALHNAYVVKDADTKFYINESKVDVDEENFAKVSLLFDDIVSDADNEEAAGYETTLKDTALEKIDANLKDVKYQAKYLDLVDANNGNVWLTPSKDVTVYWPYPDGTNKNTKFYLVHFENLDRNIALDDVESSIESAKTELMTVETDEYGISFRTSSFSPFVLVWDGAQGQTTPPTDDGNDTTTNNNTNTTTVNVTTNNATPAQPQAAAVIPQTGDEMPVGLLGGVAAVAAAAFVALFVIRKRKKD